MAKHYNENYEQFLEELSVIDLTKENRSYGYKIKGSKSTKITNLDTGAQITGQELMSGARLILCEITDHTLTSKNTEDNDDSRKVKVPQPTEVKGHYLTSRARLTLCKVTEHKMASRSAEDNDDARQVKLPQPTEVKGHCLTSCTSVYADDLKIDLTCHNENLSHNKKVNSSTPTTKPGPILTSKISEEEINLTTGQPLTWGTIEDDASDLTKGEASWGNIGCDLAAEELREACGVFGCVLAKETPHESVNAAQVIYLGLVALQHRGQESAGIVTSEGRGTKSFHYYKGEGLVASIFTDDKVAKLKGTLGIGHSRYSTAGGRDPCNTQPFVVHTRHGPLATSHNGELINAVALRKTVLDRGVGLSTCSDSELITQMLSLTPPRGEKDGPDWGARIRHLMEATPTAYSLALLHEDKIYGVRDPFGNRPLCIGRLMPLDAQSGADSPKPLGWVLSSESCAFQSVGAVLIREVYPGEIVELGPHGVRSLDLVPRPKPPLSEATGGSEHVDPPNIREAPPPAFCIFEYVYFARADSIYEGQQVYSVRKRCGRQLAIEAPVDADIISTIPESATPAAVGFALQSGLPYVEVLCKNRYVGRSFIQPDTRSRQLAVAKKFGAITENLVGRSVVLVDDSIVRGTTVGPIIRLLRQSGAREVHIRIASPPIHHPCYMGINIPTRGELIANKKPLEELAGFIGADSLAYLSIEGLVKAVTEGVNTESGAQPGHCTACLDGKYPVHLEW